MGGTYLSISFEGARIEAENQAENWSNRMETQDITTGLCGRSFATVDKTRTPYGK